MSRLDSLSNKKYGSFWTTKEILSSNRILSRRGRRYQPIKSLLEPHTTNLISCLKSSLALKRPALCHAANASIPCVSQ